VSDKKLFLTERKEARICAKGVTMRSSPWLQSKKKAQLISDVASIRVERARIDGFAVRIYMPLSYQGSLSHSLRINNARMWWLDNVITDSRLGDAFCDPCSYVWRVHRCRHLLRFVAYAKIVEWKKGQRKIRVHAGERVILRAYRFNSMNLYSSRDSR